MYCCDCHSQETGEGKFFLHDIDGNIANGQDVIRWEKTLEMLSLGLMPPTGESQPLATKKKLVTDWIQAELKKIGRGPDEGKLALPSQGNRVSHDELFSGKHLGPAYSPSRRWRISPQIYSRFAGERRVQLSQPLLSLGGKGIQDYSSLLADESTIQTMLRNGNLVADRLMYVPRERLHHLFKEDASPSNQDVNRAVEQLFQLFFQREPTPDDRTRYIDGLFNRTREKAGLELAMRNLIVAMLMSQEFVFRLEIGLGEKLADGRRRLSPMELAYSLSFAFFDQPDRSLIQAAQNGKLTTRDDVEREVRRILNRPDEKRRYWNYPMYHMWGRDYYQHQPRVLRFFQEFFGYTGAPDVFKDKERNPDHHANRLRKDADMLVLSILEQDRNVLQELLTTRQYPMDPLRDQQIEKALKEKDNRYYRGIRERMGDQVFEDVLKSGLWPGMQSKHVSAYNLVNERAEAVRRKPGQPVTFPAHERAGMLTHPAWLVAHSGNFDNDPIRRGKWIREKLLAGMIPDVPIGVDARVPEDPHKTLRERMEVVRPAECWRCHKLMNPLGEVFEAYDDFGQFREKIVVGDADAYRKAKRKYEHDRRRTLEEISRWRKLDSKGRLEKTREAAAQLVRLKKPAPQTANYPAQLRRYENDQKRWTNEKKKWSTMSDQDQRREIEKLEKRLAQLAAPIPETRPLNTRGELHGTGENDLDGPVRDAPDLVQRLARSERVRQSFVRHAFRFWMGRNETLTDSPTLRAADQAYVTGKGSFKELLVSLLTSDSFLYRKDAQEK